jgi:microcystin-dependent protein
VAPGRDSSQTEYAAIGMTGGNKTHTMTTGELVGHTHAVTGVSVAN